MLAFEEIRHNGTDEAKNTSILGTVTGKTQDSSARGKEVTMPGRKWKNGCGNPRFRK